MGLFGKKKHAISFAETKCPVEGCAFTCDDSFTMKKHTDFKHPELAKQAVKK